MCVHSRSCVHVCSLWLREILARLFPRQVNTHGLGAGGSPSVRSLNPEQVSAAFCLHVSSCSQEEEDRCAPEPFSIPHLAQGLQSGSLEPFLHFTVGSVELDDCRVLEARGFRWHQACLVCCTFLALAQVFPLPGKPVPSPPCSAFKTECKCLSPRQNQ